MIVVFDTNALVWAFEGSKSLGRRAEHRDRLHGQAGVDAEEGADAAVAPRELPLHQPDRDRREAGAAVALDGAAGDPELSQLGDQLEGELPALPVVVDDWDDLPVAEAADPSS